jgi:hypothetical protein
MIETTTREHDPDWQVRIERGVVDPAYDRRQLGNAERDAKFVIKVPCGPDLEPALLIAPTTMPAIAMSPNVQWRTAWAISGALSVQHKAHSATRAISHIRFPAVTAIR